PPRLPRDDARRHRGRRRHRPPHVLRLLLLQERRRVGRLRRPPPGDGGVARRGPRPPAADVAHPPRPGVAGPQHAPLRRLAKRGGPLRRPPPRSPRRRSAPAADLAPVAGQRRRRLRPVAGRRRRRPRRPPGRVLPLLAPAPGPIGSHPMRFAISIPQVVEDGAFDPDALQRFLARAEELGFESAWTQEQVLGTVPVLGPLETMAYAVACTTRLRFGCAVLITTLHSPVHLAKSVSTLDQLSRGRVEIGVGTGGRRMFSAFGVVPETFV